jgi:hypothetical protein
MCYNDFLRWKYMDLLKLDQEILNNRGNVTFLNDVIGQLKEIRAKLDWQVNKFLTDQCKGVLGIALTELDSTNPKYRYYNYKCGQYASVERLVRIAEAYKK